MERPGDEKYIALLYTAFHSPHGIIIQTDDLDFTRSRLYSARNRHGNIALYDLQAKRGPDGKLWLVKGAGEPEWWKPGMERKGEGF